MGVSFIILVVFVSMTNQFSRMGNVRTNKYVSNSIRALLFK